VIQPVPEEPEAPSPRGEKRGPDGRYLPGTCGGPGNPHAGAVAAWRKALVLAVPPADLEAVIRVLLERAKADEPCACGPFAPGGPFPLHAMTALFKATNALGRAAVDLGPDGHLTAAVERLRRVVVLMEAAGPGLGVEAGKKRMSMRHFLGLLEAAQQFRNRVCAVRELDKRADPRTLRKPSLVNRLRFWLP